MPHNGWKYEISIYENCGRFSVNFDMISDIESESESVTMYKFDWLDYAEATAKRTTWADVLDMGILPLGIPVYQVYPGGKPWYGPWYGPGGPPVGYVRESVL